MNGLLRTGVICVLVMTGCMSLVQESEAAGGLMARLRARLRGNVGVGCYQAPVAVAAPVYAMPVAAPVYQAPVAAPPVYQAPVAAPRVRLRVDMGGYYQAPPVQLQPRLGVGSGYGCNPVGQQQYLPPVGVGGGFYR